MRSVIGCLLMLPMMSYAGLQQAVLDSKAVVFGTYAIGGDEMGRQTYQDGHSESVFAGSGVAVGMGWQLEPAPNMGIQAGLSYFYDLADTDKGDVYFKRYPLDLLTYYRAGRHKLGTGITYHLQPTLDVSGDDSAAFSDAQGFLFQYGYKTLDGPEFGLRIITIQYDSGEEVLISNGTQADRFNGNSVGLFTAFAF